MPDTPNYSDFSDSSLWETNVDEKTYSDDFDVGDAQTEKFGILVHDKYSEKPTVQPHSPSVQDDILADDLTSSPPATTTHLPLTKSKQKRVKKLVKKAIRTKKDSRKDVIQKTVLDVIKKNLIDLFKSSTILTILLSEYELTKKLYDMMFQIKYFNTHEHHSTLYSALMNSMHINELVAKGELDLMPIFKKITHDDQDPPENHKGETKKRRCKNIGGSFSQKDKAPIQVAQKKVKIAFKNADSSSRVELIPSKIKYPNKAVLNFHKEFLALSSFKRKGMTYYFRITCSSIRKKSSSKLPNENSFQVVI
nr:hypothetical protein [Tanacetum cinerariifolium]